METTLDTLTQALPEQFPFYHLGEVRRNTAPSRERSLADLRLDDQIAIGFRLSGDLQAMMVVVLDQGLDVSMYSEVGNILASQLVTQLAHKDLDIILSPPLPLQDRQLELLTRSSANVRSRDYFHAHGKHLIPVQVLLFTGALDV